MRDAFHRLPAVPVSRKCPGNAVINLLSSLLRFILPDGTTAEVRYFADELGYRAESPLIPTPHPLPAHAIEQIRFAESQRGK